LQALLDRLENLDWDRWSAPALAGVRILLIVFAAWLAMKLLQRVTQALPRRIAAHMDGAEHLRRAETLSRVLRYQVGLVIGAIALMLVLSEVGISLAPILGAAGVVGLAVGFGAQSLVKDYFTGFFLLFEDQIRTGDVVEIAGTGGQVEDLTLRHVRLRDYDGNVHFIPNSTITRVTNMSRQFAQSVIDVRVALREDVDQILALMREVARELRADAAMGPRILEDLEIAGVERWEESALILRCRFKVEPLAQWDVRREYLRRLKKALDARGVEMPVPQLRLQADLLHNGEGVGQPLRG
jgi:small-conductance mechanosensitive channel